MKILVTGAGGFLGKRILARLLEHGQTDIRCMLRDTSKGATLQTIAAAYPAATAQPNPGKPSTETRKTPANRPDLTRRKRASSINPAAGQPEREPKPRRASHRASRR